MYLPPGPALLGAVFDGESFFPNYGHDFSSMIIAGLAAPRGLARS